MKITGNRVEGFLRQPGDGTAAVLLFGPDQGLVRERAEILVRTVVGDPDDPFRVVETTGAAIKADPAGLADEAAQLSMTGGRRVVWVREAADGVAEIFKAWLKGAGEVNGEGALVIVEAGNLGRSSSLRGLFQRSKTAAAIGCYVDEARDIAAVVRETLGRHGLRASRDAVAYLTQNLGGDRKVTRSELDKLALYAAVGGAGETAAEVTLEDAVAAIGDSGAMSLDKVAFAAGGGDLAALDRALERAYLEGIDPVGVLRAAQRHLQRLHQAQGMVRDGKSVDQAMKSLKPVVIFIFADRFRAQVRQWRPERLAAALELLTEAELDCKSTGFPGGAGCHRALMRVAQAARAAA